MSFILQKHRTALMIAAENGDFESVQIFVLHQAKAKVDFNIKDDVSSFLCFKYLVTNMTLVYN